MKNVFYKSSLKLVPIILFFLIVVFYGCEEDQVPPAVIQFAEEAQILTEGSETTISITLSKSAPANCSVDLRFQTNAVYNQHYTTIPASQDGKVTLSIVKGQKEVFFKIITINNDEFDNGKFIKLQLDNLSNGLKLGLVRNLSITLGDDEGPSFANFEKNAAIINELDENGVEVKILLSTPAKGTGAFTITFSSSAFYGNDFITSPAMTTNFITQNILPGQTDFSFTVIPIHNFKATQNQQIEFRISSTSGVVLRGTSFIHSLTIINVDDEALVNFATTSGTLEENNANGIIVEIPFTAQAPGEGSITITFPPNSNYGTWFTTVPTAASNNTILLPVSNKQEKASFKVLPVNNTSCSNGLPSINFKISFANGSLKKGTALDYSLTLQDDEVTSFVEFAQKNGDVLETNTGGIEIKLNLSNPLIKDEIVIINVSTCDYAGTRYTTDPTTICDYYYYYYGSYLALGLLQGQTSGAIKVFPINNTEDGNFLFSFSFASTSSTCLQIGTITGYVLTIIDDD